jgi:hypothetical protein
VHQNHPTGGWPPPQNAAARPVIAAIRAERSILSAKTSVSGQSVNSLQLRQWPLLGIPYLAPTFPRPTILPSVPVSVRPKLRGV